MHLLCGFLLGFFGLFVSSVLRLKRNRLFFFWFLLSWFRFLDCRFLFFGFYYILWATRDQPWFVDWRIIGFSFHSEICVREYLSHINLLVVSVKTGTCWYEFHNRVWR